MKVLIKNKQRIQEYKDLKNVFIYLFGICMSVWWPEDTLLELVLSYHSGPGAWTQAVTLVAQDFTHWVTLPAQLQSF